MDVVEFATLDAPRRARFGALLAAWHSDEWGHLYDPTVWNRAVAEAEFAAMDTVGTTPSTWVAIDGDSLIASISLLDTDDLDGFESLGPWLASLYVVPEARSRGLGARLTAAVIAAAGQRGADTVYLFTSGQERYYGDRGWHVVAHTTTQGHPAAVMARATSTDGGRRAVASRWASNPDVGGAYSYLRAGASPAARRRLAEPILPGLWFAGEHTSSDHPATMHGAWFSGERAAQQVAATCVQPTSTTGDTDVLVVGAGFAGLAAARSLVDAGWGVVVVDSADQLGGRAAIDSSLGVPLPLGGAWLHGIEGHPLRDRIAAVADDWNYQQIYVLDHGRVDVNLVDTVAALEDTVIAQVGEASSGTTVAEALVVAVGDLQPRSALAGHGALVLDHLLRTYFESLYAAPMHDAGADVVNENYSLPGADHFIVGNLQTVFDDLATGVDVRLGHRVGALTYDGDRWHTDTGVHAPEVIITVPIGALRAGQPRFDPPLPDDVAAAIQQIGAGPVCKLFVTYDRRWWPETRALYTVGPDAPSPLVAATDITDLTGVPTLMWFAVGDDARRIEAMSEHERLRLADDVARRTGLC